MSAPCCNRPTTGYNTTLGLPGASLQSALTQGCYPVQASQLLGNPFALNAAIGDRADAALQMMSSQATLQPSVLAEQVELGALSQLGPLQVPSVDGTVAQLSAPVAAAIGALPVAPMFPNPAAYQAAVRQLAYGTLAAASQQPQLTTEQARCVGAAAARMNLPVTIQPSDTLALGVPAFCGGPTGGMLGAGYCAPTDLAAAAVARAVYVRGTTQCLNNCAQTGACCQGNQCLPPPGACAARLAGLGNPNIPLFNGWVQPFPVNATM